MEYRRFENTYVVRLDPGEELVEQILTLARQELIALAAVQGIGAVSDLTVGAFIPDEKRYQSSSFQGCFEIVSLSGTLTTKDGEPYCHLHMSAGDDLGRVVGGHLNRAVISATGELIITVIPGMVDRAFDESIGLNLFQF